MKDWDVYFQCSFFDLERVKEKKIFGLYFQELHWSWNKQGDHLL
jgi:hypothetical protein